MSAPKVYLAGPFFTPPQVEFIDRLELLLTELGYRMFSPRLGENARIMNAAIKDGSPVTREMRFRTFTDNCVNIEDAALMVAFIDDFDTGTVFEMGGAYMGYDLPIISVTNQDFGLNLMLAESVVGHCKGIDQLRDALTKLKSSLDPFSQQEDFAQVMGEVLAVYKTPDALREGPIERMNA